MALFVCFYKDVWEGLQCVIIHNIIVLCLVLCRPECFAINSWLSIGMVFSCSGIWSGEYVAARLCNLYCRSSSNVKALHVNTGEHHNNYTTQGIIIIILDYQFLDIYEFLSKPCRDIDCYLLTKYLVL